MYSSVPIKRGVLQAGGNRVNGLSGGVGEGVMGAVEWTAEVTFLYIIIERTSSRPVCLLLDQFYFQFFMYLFTIFTISNVYI